MDSQRDPQFEYVQGQARPSFSALLADYEKASQAAVEASPCELDLRYGPAPRQVFDFFSVRGTRAQATLVYFHAGYWQSRDKSLFRFLAPALTAAGFHVALVNYPLCPTVSVVELIDAAAASLPAVAQRAMQAGSTGEQLPLVLAGHSAGAHIALELALREAQAPSTGVTLAGILAISGIYELTPLLSTTLNEKLQLDASSAAACSPVHRLRPSAVPALVVVGATETPAFHAQSQKLLEMWVGQGNRGRLLSVPHADHFSVLQELTRPGSALFTALEEMKAVAGG